MSREVIRLILVVAMLLYLSQSMIAPMQLGRQSVGDAPSIKLGPITPRKCTASKTLKNVTLITKSTVAAKPGHIQRLLQSVRACYPSLPILFGDDSVVDNPVQGSWNVTFLPLPKDSGVSVGRNRLIEQVKTPFFIYVDEDIIFTEQTDIQKMLDMLFLYKVDLVGGAYQERQRTYSYGLDMHTISSPESGTHIRFTKTTKILDKEGCRRVDVVHNFFVARTARMVK